MGRGRGEGGGDLEVEEEWEGTELVWSSIYRKTAIPRDTTLNLFSLRF